MIVIPMAGLSSRFTKTGYRLPKYMLPLWGATVFDQALLSFARYFTELPFLFVLRDVSGSLDFVRRRCKALKISHASFITLDAPTAGQAETVRLGLEAVRTDANTPLTIFNIDTFRPGFVYPACANAPSVEGYLEVFRGQGANWSYVLPKAKDSDQAARTAEKKPISDLCCTGLYHFARAASFMQALEAESTADQAGLAGGELYVAPLYNRLIAAGADIRFHQIGQAEVVFCGVPAEYEALAQGPLACANA